MAGGRRCPSDSGVAWAKLDMGTFACPSTVNMNPNNQVSFDAALGYDFATNDTATFARTLSTGASPYYGLSMIRSGTYRIDANAPGFFSTGAAHNTVRAWMTITGPPTSAVSSLYGLSSNSYLNVSGPSVGIDADAQGWDMYNTWMIVIPAGAALPRGPYTILLAQESGVDVNFFPVITATRLGDAAVIV